MDTNEKTNKVLEALQEHIDLQQKSVDNLSLEYRTETAKLHALKESQAIVKQALDS